MKTALVTGHLGFIGSHLVRSLTDDGYKVTGLDVRENNNDICWCPLPKNVDEVYHLAAQTNAYSTNATLDAEVNILGSIRIFSLYKDKVRYASSAMVNHPKTPYAISKLAAEHYAKLYGVRIVRFPNIFGLGGHSCADRFDEDAEIIIYGDGSQKRTYAPVDAAVYALRNRASPDIYVLGGTDYTVLDIANMYPDKPRKFLPMREFDFIDGVQK